MQPALFPGDFWSYHPVGWSFTILGKTWGAYYYPHPRNPEGYHTVTACSVIGFSVDIPLDELGDEEIVIGVGSHLGLGLQMSDGKIVGMPGHAGFAIGGPVSIVNPLSDVDPFSVQP